MLTKIINPAYTNTNFTGGSAITLFSDAKDYFIKKKLVKKLPIAYDDYIFNNIELMEHYKDTTSKIVSLSFDPRETIFVNDIKTAFRMASKSVLTDSFRLEDISALIEKYPHIEQYVISPITGTVLEEFDVPKDVSDILSTIEPVSKDVIMRESIENIVNIIFGDRFITFTASEEVVKKLMLKFPDFFIKKEQLDLMKKYSKTANNIFCNSLQKIA